MAEVIRFYISSLPNTDRWCVRLGTVVFPCFPLVRQCTSTHAPFIPTLIFQVQRGASRLGAK